MLPIARQECNFKTGRPRAFWQWRCRQRRCLLLATPAKAAVASVAMVSNAIDHAGEQFNTGSQEDGLRILEALGRAARSFLAE